jgi:hypothetical protein
MEADQDWCLNCGTAAPGSLGERPGWRAASTVIALALLLVLGAIGAGYAALTGDSTPQQQASTPPPAATAPPAAQTTPPATTPPATGQGDGEAQPTTPTQTAKPQKLPKVKAPSSGSTQGSPVTPTPPASAPSTGTGTGTGTTPPATSTPGTTPTEPADTGPQAIDLNGDAGTVYDPYSRVKASGETTRALDGDTTTSWYVDPKDPAQIAVGYAVDLGKLQGVRQIELQTPTPGFRVEIYATDETELPPNILDTRWSHIKDVSNVGAKDDGKQKIVLGAGTTKYRNVLLWFTQPPTDAPRLRLTELKLLG